MRLIKQSFYANLASLAFCSVTWASTETITLKVDNWGDYISRDGNNHGVMSEIIKKSFEAVDVTISFQWVPWKRIEEIEIDNHKAVSFGWIHNSNRAERWHYSAPVFTSGDILISRNDNPVKWQQLKDIKPYKIGVTRGYSHGEEFDAAKKMATNRIRQHRQSKFKKTIGR